MFKRKRYTKKEIPILLENEYAYWIDTTIYSRPSFITSKARLIVKRNGKWRSDDNSPRRRYNIITRNGWKSHRIKDLINKYFLYNEKIGKLRTVHINGDKRDFRPSNIFFNKKEIYVDVDKSYHKTNSKKNSIKYYLGYENREISDKDFFYKGPWVSIHEMNKFNGFDKYFINPYGVVRSKIEKIDIDNEKLLMVAKIKDDLYTEVRKVDFSSTLKSPVYKLIKRRYINNFPIFRLTTKAFLKNKIGLKKIYFANNSRRDQSIYNISCVKRKVELTYLVGIKEDIWELREKGMTCKEICDRLGVFKVCHVGGIIMEKIRREKEIKALENILETFKTQ